MSNKERFDTLIASHIAQNLVYPLGAFHAEVGLAADEHTSEGHVQDQIIKMLRAILPRPTLVSKGKELLNDRKLGGCIPDILIERIGKGYWGAIELKTLLVDDQLSVDKIHRDLDKLCAYKNKFPNIAAVFILVGSSSKLFNSQRIAAWKDLKISYQPATVANPQPIAQSLNSDDYVALPCGSFNENNMKLCIFMWEVVKRTNSQLISGTYSFEAKML